MIKPVVGIVDYGVGNLRSVVNAVTELNAKPIVSGNSNELRSCDRIILPGVGAFRHGMEALKNINLLDFLRNITDTKIPLLGICLGMQMLTEQSDEFGLSEGIGLLPGSVTKLSSSSALDKFRLPNVGWLKVSRVSSHHSELVDKMFYKISADAKYYFVHSYSVDYRLSISAGISEYQDVKFASVISGDHIVGTQFHPEKSGKAGLQMLKNFIW